MPDIKTKEVVKGTVKTLDRASTVAQHVKSAYVRTREDAESTVSADEHSAADYGAARVQNAAVRTGKETAHQLKKHGNGGVRNVKRNLQETKDTFQKLKDLGKKNQPKKTIRQTVQNPARSASRSVQATGRGTIKTAGSAGKGTVKTAQKGVKTAQNSGKLAVKTAKQTVKTAQAAAKASARAARVAAQTAKAVAKATAAGIKLAVKATIAATKAIIAAAKALWGVIAAGGWVAVVIILIVCVVALIVGSCFGIFFSNESSAAGQTMQSAMQEINADYQTQVDTIKANTAHDVLEISGGAAWKETLAVYAVKTSMDPNNPQEVATMDDTKKAVLKEIFWQMHTLSSRTETKTETLVTETNDGHGNIERTETTVTRTYLYITVSHSSVEEMADQYGFTADQRTQLTALLSAEYDSLWDTVLNNLRNHMDLSAKARMGKSSRTIECKG